MAKKNFVFLTFILILVFIPSRGFTMYVGNMSDIAFTFNGTLKGNSTGSTYTIKELIIHSATHFLKGKSHLDLLVSKLESAELEPINFLELQKLANDSLYCISEAKNFYLLLKNQADVTPYNPMVIDQLTVFDYDSLALNAGMNPDIFNHVKKYLKSSDVRGAYNQLYSYTNNIVSMLEVIKKDIYHANIPAVNHVWNVNQECARMLLFGQYIAQVFQNLI